MVFVFVVAVGFVLYTYLLYPVAIVFLSQFVGKRTKEQFAVAPQPVAVVVPAHNEAAVIATKIDNILRSNYPAELLRVVVISDGSSDDTAACARAVDDPRVTVIERKKRGGKAAAINQALAEVSEPIVVLTDAAEMFDTNAIALLAQNLADPRVGAVSGRLRMIEENTGFSKNLGLYWRYETMMRNAESRLFSTIGVTGAIYAIRRECFSPIAPNTILDDLAIPLEVIRHGHRVCFEPRAIAYEEATSDVRQEFLRKRRTLAGNFQILFRYYALLNPFTSPIALQLWSHKVFRLLVPYALLAIFISSWWLQPPYGALLLALQAAFYSTALLVFLVRKHVNFTLLSLPYTFCALNWAAIASAYYYFSGLQTARWEKTK